MELFLGITTDTYSKLIRCLVKTLLIVYLYGGICSRRFYRRIFMEEFLLKYIIMYSIIISTLSMVYLHTLEVNFLRTSNIRSEFETPQQPITIGE